MKNARRMLKKIYLILLCMLSGVFIFSCGLEEIIVVDEPTVTYNDPLYSGTDYSKWYHNFKTSSDSGDSFIGTDVYYKIYNNYSNLTSQRSSILNVNTSSNGSAAATRMIETYTYQQLGASTATGNSVYFPKSEKGKTVVFRLKTYTYADSDSATADDRYTAHACVGIKNGTTYSYESYIPYRNGNSKSFDFFDDDDDDDNDTRDTKPVEGDSDFYYNSTASEDDTYYVQLFAVAVAFDSSSVSNSYSLVLDLGSVPIRKGE